MDHSFRSQPALRLPRPLLALLKFLGRTWAWLGGFVQLSQDEQRAAGIYLGDERFE